MGPAEGGAGAATGGLPRKSHRGGGGWLPHLRRSPVLSTLWPEKNTRCIKNSDLEGPFFDPSRTVSLSSSTGRAYFVPEVSQPELPWGFRQMENGFRRLGPQASRSLAPEGSRVLEGLACLGEVAQGSLGGGVKSQASCSFYGLSATENCPCHHEDKEGRELSSPTRKQSPAWRRHAWPLLSLAGTCLYSTTQGVRSAALLVSFWP